MKRTSAERRSGVTLIEVLVAIFVMSIGLLCVLTLFVLGAQRMAVAFKDSNATQAAINARALVSIKNLRNDPAVVAAFQGPDTDPSTAVFVDPVGKVVAGATFNNLPAGSPLSIQRVSPSYAPDNSGPYLPYFAIFDDITFQRGNGSPKFYGPNLEREILYTWAYLVQRQRKSDAASTIVSTCVFQRRPKAGHLEATFDASMNTNDNTITLTKATLDSLSPGAWVLDATPQVGGRNQIASFYRVTGVRDNGFIGSDSSVVLDLQSSLQGYPTGTTAGKLVVMDGLVEVFELGTGR